MNAGARLGLFAVGAAAAFAGAFGLTAAVVPDELATQWEGPAQMEHDDRGMESMPATPAGLVLAASGYELSPVTAPAAAGEPGELSFRILDADGEAVTSYTVAHEQRLHLIVVRSDGAGFRHVHPALDAASGTWSIPWTWDAAGSYRVYADFVPGATDAHESVTLTRLVQVAGEFEPAVVEGTSRTDAVDGFDVSLEGELVAGGAGELTFTVSRGGEPVTALEPYLGALGHLVALREGDLAYLHAHPAGEEPEADAASGPEIAFELRAPTAGRYLLYLDFQVDGEVHTARFVLDAARAR